MKKNGVKRVPWKNWNVGPELLRENVAWRDNLGKGDIFGVSYDAGGAVGAGYSIPISCNLNPVRSVSRKSHRTNNCRGTWNVFEDCFEKFDNILRIGREPITSRLVRPIARQTTASRCDLRSDVTSNLINTKSRLSKKNERRILMGI